MKIKLFEAVTNRIPMLSHLTTIRTPLSIDERINMKYGGNGYRSIYEQRKEASKARNAYVKTYMTPNGRRGR